MDIEYFKKLQNAHGTRNKREKELMKVNRNSSKHFDDTFDTEDVLVNDKPMQLMIVHDTDLNVYKKKIKSRHEDVFNLGDYVIWNDQVWLITLIDPDNAKVGAEKKITLTETNTIDTGSVCVYKADDAELKTELKSTVAGKEITLTDALEEGTEVVVNAVLQMFGYNTLPIADADVSEIVSTVFLIGATLYNTWKNRNVSSASQTGQKVVDAIKSGELLADEVEELLAKVRK